MRNWDPSLKRSGTYQLQDNRYAIRLNRNRDQLLFKAYMKSYIPLETAVIFFSTEPSFKNRVLARSMPLLTSFHWATRPVMSTIRD